MSNYEVKWQAQGVAVVEAPDSDEAAQDVLDRLLDLEHADANVTFERVSYSKVTEV